MDSNNKIPPLLSSTDSSSSSSYDEMPPLPGASDPSLDLFGFGNSPSLGNFTQPYASLQQGSFVMPPFPETSLQLFDNSPSLGNFTRPYASLQQESSESTMTAATAAASGDEVSMLKAELAAVKAQNKSLLFAAQQTLHAQMSLIQSYQVLDMVVKQTQGLPLLNGMEASASMDTVASAPNASSYFQPGLSTGPVDLSSGGRLSLSSGLPSADLPLGGRVSLPLQSGGLPATSSNNTTALGHANNFPRPSQLENNVISMPSGGLPSDDMPSGGPTKPTKTKSRQKTPEERVEQWKRVQRGDLTENDEEYPSFKAWLYNTQQSYSNDKFSEKHIKRLQAAGFVFPAKKKQTTFEHRLKDLKEYKAQNGHFNVSRSKGTESEKSLGHWVYNVRKTRQNLASKKNEIKLTADRIAALNAINFTWEMSSKRKQSSEKEETKKKTRKA